MQFLRDSVDFFVNNFQNGRQEQRRLHVINFKINVCILHRLFSVLKYSEHDLPEVWNSSFSFGIQFEFNVPVRREYGIEKFDKFSLLLFPILFVFY